ECLRAGFWTLQLDSPFDGPYLDAIKITPRQIIRIAIHLLGEMYSPRMSRERTATRMKLVLSSGNAYEMSSFESERIHSAFAATKESPHAHTHTLASRDNHQLAEVPPCVSERPRPFFKSTCARPFKKMLIQSAKVELIWNGPGCFASAL